MGVGCGRGDRCGCGNRYGRGSSIVVLEFVFAGLVGGGWVFLGFCGGGWSVVKVEISVAMEIDVAVGLDFVFTGLVLNEFGFVSVVFYLCGFICFSTLLLCLLSNKIFGFMGLFLGFMGLIY